MRRLSPDNFDLDERKGVADRVDSERYIAERPIYLFGCLAFYWSLGRKERVDAGAAIHVRPRVRWVR